MPELPEVETVKETLKTKILNHRIDDVIIFYSGIIHDILPEVFKTKIIGQHVRDIRRKGKYLLFDLDDYTLVIHLRMEGKFYLKKALENMDKHDHLAFLMDDSRYLSYHDVRKFGTMNLVDKYHEEEVDGVSRLGPDAHQDILETGLIYPQIKSSKRPIKSLLLDQHIIAGLGNIYVDETLFRAKIHPQTLGSALTYYQIEKMLKYASKVIHDAIRLGGTTIRSYHALNGVDGRFQNELKVHTHKGQPCPVCHTEIIKSKVAGRGTYYCPSCQKRNPPLLLGLTGGIASGKTLVSTWFKNHQIALVDADKIYKKLLKSDKIMYNEIVKCFGSTIIGDDGIDTKKLGHIVFADSTKREMLNQITHPHVIEAMNKKVLGYQKKGQRLIVLDIPLLFEANLQYLVDLVMVVYVDKDQQVSRLMQRSNLSQSDALQRINAQMSLEEKRRLADMVIDNNHDPQKTYKQLKDIIDQLRRDGYVD